jgi:hypothetical protein
MLLRTFYYYIAKWNFFLPPEKSQVLPLTLKSTGFSIILYNLFLKIKFVVYFQQELMNIRVVSIIGNLMKL